MDLDGEIVSGIKNFDEKGESLANEVVAEDFGAMVCPEVIEGLSGVGA